MANLKLQLANALLLGGDGFADTRQTCLLGVNLIEPAPDNALHQVQILADLLETQALGLGPWALGLGPWALGLDHLYDLEFETRIKGSSGFLTLHVLCHLDFLEKTYRCINLNQTTTLRAVLWL